MDPNNLSRAECKVLVEAVCCREQSTGKNILTEMWERYDRHVLRPLLKLPMQQAMQAPEAYKKFQSQRFVDDTYRAGLQRPTVEVRFENICVTARVLVGEHGRPTVLNYYSSGVAVRIDYCIRWQPDCNLVPSSLEARIILCSMSRLPFGQAHKWSYAHAVQATGNQLAPRDCISSCTDL